MLRLTPTLPLVLASVASLVSLACAPEVGPRESDLLVPQAAPRGNEAAPLQTLTATPAWQAAAPAGTARGQHAAVLLPTGEVLIAGGVNRTGFVSTAEIFDPVAGMWASVAVPGIQGNIMSGLLLSTGEALVLADGSTSARRFDPGTRAWTATGDMAAARSLATLTRLGSGKILVAGGSNLSTAELFDPETNTFTPTGSLSVVHRAHVAALLRDGRVLLVSGFSNSAGEVPVAELYDPHTGTWSLAAPPLVPRHYATATLLPDGRVLLVGGRASVGVTTQAELYDPVANVWTATGSLAFPRNGHTATLLPSGKVLVAGGSDGSRAVQLMTETYDPATGLWSPSGPLHEGRENHIATLLPSGRVLLVGGFFTNPSTTFLASTELFDPAVHRMLGTGPQAQPRSSEPALLPSGQVLLAGGADGSGAATATTSFFEPTTGAWTSAPAMQEARAHATASLLDDGEVLVVGGVDAVGQALRTAERFSPVVESWSAARPMAEARRGHTATRLLDGSILIVGGRADGGAVSSSTERFSPSEDAWSSGPSLLEGRHAHGATRLSDGRVFIAGGEVDDGSATHSVELLPAAGDVWSSTAPMSEARAHFTLTLLPDGRVLAVGGQSGATVLSSAELFDPSSETWIPAGTLSAARAGHTAVLMASGKVLIAGGRTAGGTATTSLEIYDPALRRFFAVGGGPASAAMSSVCLPDGSVLLVGSELPQGAERYEDLDAQPAWRPVVIDPGVLVQGCEATISGTGFLGISEGSGGSYNSAPGNAPLLRLKDPESGALWTLPTRDHSATTATTRIPEDLPTGAYALSVFSNAIPGGRMVRVERNAPPIAEASDVTVQRDTATSVRLQGSDDDAGQALTWTVLTPPMHGTLSGTAPELVYMPETGYVGPDSFTFQLADCGLQSAPTTLSLQIVDPAPVTHEAVTDPGGPHAVGCSCQSTAGEPGAGPGALTLLAGLIAWMHWRRRLRATA